MTNLYYLPGGYCQPMTEIQWARTNDERRAQGLPLFEEWEVGTAFRLWWAEYERKMGIN